MLTLNLFFMYYESLKELSEWEEYLEYVIPYLLQREQDIASPCEVFLTSFISFLVILPLEACESSFDTEEDLSLSRALFWVSLLCI